MKLGIIGAMTVEIESLKAQMENLEITQKAGMEFCAGTLEGLPVVVVVCGVGKVNAAMCVQVLFDCFAVTYIINTGTKKFHGADCGNGQQTKEENKEIYSGDRQKLIDDGYVPAGCCNP